MIASSAMVAEGAVIDINDFPKSIQQQRLHPKNRDDYDLISLSEMEYRHATRVLAKVGGSQTRAAEILGIGRSTLYRLLRKVGVGTDGGAIGGNIDMPGAVKRKVTFHTQSHEVTI